MSAPALRAPDRQLGLLLAGLSLVSLAFFAGRIYGVVDMNFVTSFVALPATILGVGLARWAGHRDASVFYRRLLLGLLFGLAATAAYDGIRLVLQTVLPLNFNAFAIHPRFGELIIGRPHTTTAALIVGWAYHITNGLSFALAYTFVAGRAPWWYGLIYALALQSLMVLMYPTAFGVSRGSEAFLIVSFVGHAAYGSVLGILNQRYNVDEPHALREGYRT